MLSTSWRNTGDLPKDPSRTSFVGKTDIFVTAKTNLQTVTARGDSETIGSQKGRVTALVGYSDLPHQIHKKAVSRGFTFNLMVTGSPGLGKSTFINSLFCSDIYNSENPGPSVRPTSGVTRVDCRSFVISESNVKLHLRILDTPGFGQLVDNSHCWEPIVACLESQFDEYLKAELSVSRTTLGSGVSYIPSLPEDNRTHACIYFINPNGHGLHQLDIETMKRLHDKVNLIAVIGKADSMTADERHHFKQTVRTQLEENKINVYNFPQSVVSLGGEATDKVLQEILEWRERQPFAVACSGQLIKEADGRRVRGRVYPWGVMETDNQAHNDFVALQNLLLNVHLQDLIDVTTTEHYAKFFAAKMTTIAEASQFPTEPDAREPLSQLEAERNEQKRRLSRMEADMEAVFEQKVAERTRKLEESRRELEQRTKQLSQQLATEASEYEKQKRHFEEERSIWEAENQDILETGVTTQPEPRIFSSSIDYHSGSSPGLRPSFGQLSTKVPVTRKSNTWFSRNRSSSRPFAANRLRTMHEVWSSSCFKRRSKSADLFTHRLHQGGCSQPEDECCSSAFPSRWRIEHLPVMTVNQTSYYSRIPPNTFQPSRPSIASGQSIRRGPAPLAKPEPSNINLCYSAIITRPVSHLMVVISDVLVTFGVLCRNVRTSVDSKEKSRTKRKNLF
ncbi:cell division protein [Opisthorchis viverrini]|uniref:Cell division protein n=1 Tax=Opisthorchis viverrini TaxID=6198 RepID=A0A1S8XB78_OPIVI|nr:cell division protein [Opisthorchis viverrini]